MRSVTQRISAAVFGAPHLDERTRAGRLAATMYAASAVDLFVATPMLPADVRTAPLYVAAGLALLCAFGWLALPWHRLPARATVVPSAIAFAMIAVIGQLSHAVEHFLVFFPLAFVYLGLTQPVGTSLTMAVPAVAAGVFAETSAPDRPFVDAATAVVVAVVVGEVLGYLTVLHARARRTAESLLAAVTELTEAGDVTTAADLLAGLTRRILGVSGVAVMLADGPGSSVLRNRGQRGVAQPLGSVVVDTSQGRSGARSAMAAGRPFFVADALGSGAVVTDHARTLGVESAVYIPVGGRGGTFGVIAAWWGRRHAALDPGEARAAEILGRHAGQVLDRLQSVDRLAVEARTDPLTGLANRRGLLEELTRLTVDSVVAMVDLDHFKRVNDSEGHQAGDELLRRFAETLRSVLRLGDVAARYGGEEFAIVLPSAQSELGTAHSVLNRLQLAWQLAGCRCTFSAGVAMHRLGEPPAETLARADAALYAAKRAGRDRIVHADPPAAPVAGSVRGATR